LAGDQDQGNAVEKEDRTFEVVKLRIAFLQHITTLSGAAIVIVLALIERADTAGQAYLLAISGGMFLAAAVISLYSIMSLIWQTERVGRGRASAGRFATALANGAFAAGIISVAFFAAGGSTQSYVSITSKVGGVLLALVWVLILLRWWLRRYLG
jgi:hypothetical protein